jgi:pilus assembly protein CpaF
VSAVALSELAVQGPDGVRAFALGSAAITLGSAGDAMLRLSGDGVARCHAELVRDQASNRYWIQDLGTAQGTWVNDERVVRYGPITERDVLRIGAYSMRIRGAASATPPRARAWMRTASPETQAKRAEAPARARAGAAVTDERNALAARAHDALIERLDLRRRDIGSMQEAELRAQAAQLLDGILAVAAFESAGARGDFKQFVLDEALGLGLLEPLLRDDSVTEIMVNSATEIFIERSGRLERAPLCFSSERALRGVIERIVAGVGRRIDESSPMVDARLADGSRVNVVIPPISLRGPAITIRKFSRKRLGPADLVAFGSLSAEMMDFLAVCVEQRRNIVVSGGTGAGKTTLLNVLSSLIPSHERVVTIEDAAELQLAQANLVTLEARPRNAEGRGQVVIRDLVRNALRMRPDRIVVGECRGGEALDMLQAMNTGHDGSLTTAHANGPRDALARLEVMVLMAGMELPVSAIREQIASAVQVIVQQTRFACGTRKVTHIVEVTGTEAGTIQTQDVFRFVQAGCDAHGRVRGQFSACGYVPSFYEELAAIGVGVDRSIFSAPSAETGPL